MGADSSTYWESDLPIGDIKRYSRQIVVPGVLVDGQKAISSARVLVVGLGGLGSPVLTYLAMAGVGTIGVADFDVVELHNLQRQSVHSEKAVGTPKTGSAMEFVKRINSRINVVEHNTAVTADNCAAIIANYDLILDCCDAVELRYVLNDSCRTGGIDLISASVLRWEGQIYTVPREGCCFRCMFPVPKKGALNCDQSGVIGPMCGVVGCMQATEAVKLIMERGRGFALRSKVVLYNGFTNAHSVFTKEYRRCVVCRTGQPPESERDACSSSKCAAGGGDTDGVADWPEILGGRHKIIDIRQPVHFRMFRVRGSVNIQDVEESLDEIKKLGMPVVVLCYRGVSSRQAVRTLVAGGVEARSASGGMEGFKRFVNFDCLE